MTAPPRMTRYMQFRETTGYDGAPSNAVWPIKTGRRVYGDFYPEYDVAYITGEHAESKRYGSTASCIRWLESLGIEVRRAAYGDAAPEVGN